MKRTFGLLETPMKPALPLLTALLLVPCATRAENPTKPLDLGSRRELFVDSFLIDTLTGVSLKLHEPHEATWSRASPTSVSCSCSAKPGIGWPCAWKKNRNLAPLAGKVVRLRFVFQEADVFSLRFR